MEFTPFEAGCIVRMVLQRIQERKLSMDLEQTCESIKAFAESIQEPEKWYHAMNSIAIYMDFDTPYKEFMPVIDRAIDQVMSAPA